MLLDLWAALIPQKQGGDDAPRVEIWETRKSASASVSDKKTIKSKQSVVSRAAASFNLIDDEDLLILLMVS